MQSVFAAKEQLNADTPLFFFDCTLSDGSIQRWSSRAFTWNGNAYDARVLKHNLFEAQLASDTQVGGLPRLTFELANADSRLSEIEQQVGFKGSSLIVQSVFVDLSTSKATTESAVVFRGLMNPPETISETSFRVSAMNRISMQRTVLPNVRIERMCPWRFPANNAQRVEAVDGGPKGSYSPFYRCGYSPDQPNGTGNLNGAVPFTSCSYSRSDCEQRGIFTTDLSGRRTGRFGGVEYVPPTILVRGSGQKNYSLSAVQQNTASYNDFVPLVYGTQWHVPDVVFSRNDGNLTRMEVLLGMGEIQGMLLVLVNDIVIPQGTAGVNMTSTGWYNITTPGTRNGTQDPNFADSHGVPLGDPYGSMACLSIVVPNRINDGTSIPSVQVLMEGLKLAQFDGDGNYLTTSFSSNPAWVLLDILMRCGYRYDEIDTASFGAVAAYADQLISANDPVGGAVELPRFQCNFAIKESRSAGDLIRSIRNSSQIYLVLNTAGLLEARVENTFALQQPVKPAGSTATEMFNEGWPAYEFDASSIARNQDGSASVRLSSRGAQDTPNRISIEFQDAYNQFQQDSLSLSDADDIDLCGQEVPAIWDAAGISNFTQASRILLLGLNRAIEGNLFIQFETSVKALGLLPGDLITVTYQKENLMRTPFRILKISSGPSFRTAIINAQLHNDAWYSDIATGIVGGRGRQTGQGSGLPSPVGGTVLDSYGNLQLGIKESEVMGSDGSSNVEIDVSFTSPGAQTGSLAAPLIGLITVVSSTGGSLAGGQNYYYAVSAVDSDGRESALSFVAQAKTRADSNTGSVLIDGIQLPTGAISFNIYRGSSPGQFFQIASSQQSQPSFLDTGLPLQSVLPPDPQFDHVNVYWRWELLPETSVAIHSVTTVGNNLLQLIPDRYGQDVVRITRGTGAGQEQIIASNDTSTLTLTSSWSVEPDASSYFVVSESSWRSGARGSASPIAITVPERIGSGLHVSARAANVSNDEASYALSPLTRWTIGQSGALLADSDVPAAPAAFGLSVSPVRGGVLDAGSIGFSSLMNTRSIIAGTYKVHYYDEVYGPSPLVITQAISSGDSTVALSSPPVSGAFLQIEGEILQAGETASDGATAVQRGIHGTSPADHPISAPGYILQEKVTIVPFVKNFFGSPASGDWKYSLELPGVRVASVELFLTNALGDGPAKINPYTSIDNFGLRTLAGGQYSFQITGYLAIQSGAAPDIVVDAPRSVWQIYAVLRSPSSGAGVTLQLNLNGVPYTTIQIDPGSTQSGIVDGFGLPALHAGDQMSLDVNGVGTTNPGSDLTVIVRL